MDIDRELEDLKSFGIALREDNLLLSEKMMSEIEPETWKKASVPKYPFEVITLALILNR